MARFFSERSGFVAFFAAMMEFSNFIFYLGLLDAPCWGVVLLGLILESAHRAPGSITSCFRLIGIAIFPITLSKKLPWVLSDHFPILLECEVLHLVVRPFCFENVWLKAMHFVEKV